MLNLKSLIWSLLHFRRSWYYPGVPEINPDEVHKQLKTDKPPFLIDVRDSEDIAKSGKIEGAVFLNYFNFRMV